MSSSPSIDTLAHKLLNVHPNDKSESVRAKMVRRFGRAATEAAIQRAVNINSLLSGEPAKNTVSKHSWSKKVIFDEWNRYEAIHQRRK